MSSDSGMCPLCGAAVGCAMQAGQADLSASSKPCWCVSADFPKVLPDNIPADACICAQCAKALFLQQQSAEESQK